MSDNILSNPLAELAQALKTNTFGLTSYAILEDQSFPTSPEDLASIRQEIRDTGRNSSRVVARASIELAQGEGVVGVRLDQSGWTMENATSSKLNLGQYLSKTYESLETMLIAISPGYVEAMNREIWERFEGHVGGT